jgi:hypothetical protein
MKGLSKNLKVFLHLDLSSDRINQFYSSGKNKKGSCEYPEKLGNEFHAARLHLKKKVQNWTNRRNTAKLPRPQAC